MKINSVKRIIYSKFKHHIRLLFLQKTVFNFANYIIDNYEMYVCVLQKYKILLL